jgi:hypothetical protein
MSRFLISSLAAAATWSAANADLYYIQDEAQESLPLKWTAGANLIWDDNVNPTAVGVGADESLLSVNPFAGLSFVNISPQTTLDVYARLGLIYYFDQPAADGSEDLFTQSRVGVNWTHRLNEQLRISSRNSIAYEIEPDYANGFATTRQIGEYLNWQTDNSVGYRWTERFATYSGFDVMGLNYDESVANQDRLVWTLYNQFRYQLSEQTVATADYRYSEGNGADLASDYSDHFLLGGLEHRFSPNTILVGRAGAQFRQSDAVNGADNTSPYVEGTLRSQINSQFSVRGFARYSIEGLDTVRNVGADFYEFDKRQTFRLGTTAEYALSPMFNVFGGLDYIPSTFDDGRRVSGGGPTTANGLEEDLINAYVGLSLKFTDILYGTFSYNYTDSTSDFASQSFNRNRVSVGVRAEF